MKVKYPKKASYLFSKIIKGKSRDLCRFYKLIKRNLLLEGIVCFPNDYTLLRFA
jgi:hypothetical protein